MMFRCGLCMVSSVMGQVAIPRSCSCDDGGQAVVRSCMRMVMSPVFAGRDI